MDKISGKKLIGCKVSALKMDSASVRYRGLLQCLNLRAQGYRVRLFASHRPGNLDGLDALLMVKSLSLADFILAQEARRRNIPVILDLCDNIFIDSYKNSKLNSVPANMFLAMAALAAAVIVTTEPLADIVRAKTHNLVPVHIVPDGIESKAAHKAMQDMLQAAAQKDRITRREKLAGFARRAAYRLKEVYAEGWVFMLRWSVGFAERLARRLLKAALRRMQVLSQKLTNKLQAMLEKMDGTPTQTQTTETPHTPYDPSALQIIWFGIHGAPHAEFGMLDLLLIREALEAVAADFNVQLVVVSNNKAKYQKFIKPLRVPSRYVEWSPQSQAHELRRAAVAVIPNSNDAFSRCKSANRTVTALLAGVPVVATATPALAPLQDAIRLDDFEASLRSYLTDKTKAMDDVRRGQELVQALYGDKTVADKLGAVVQGIMAKRLQAVAQPDMLAAIHLPQDLDLILPVLIAAKARGHEVLACCSTALLNRSPRALAQLQAANMPIRVMAEEMVADDAVQLPASARVLLTAAESNLGPHTFTRLLTQIAQAQGIFTATMQHGLENNGLSYTDAEHPIDRSVIAAECIYVWGDLSRLHPQIPGNVRARCYPVGCPKPARVPAADLSGLVPDGKPLVGVFENLHWHRYSDDYRRAFMANVLQLANDNPETVFLLKPHHAGKWATAQQESDLPQLPNLIVADPDNPRWQPYTAPQLLGRMAAVITTPSTVAFDAARIDLPTAVFAYDLDLAYYAPLPLLGGHTSDWQNFVSSAIGDPQAVVQRAQDFAALVALPGDAAGRILDDLESHMNRKTIAA